MGKTAQRDVEQGALTGGSETPDQYADEPDDPEDGIDDAGAEQTDEEED